MLAIDTSFWKGRRVFLTGHTGFKGAWLHFWLMQMGADVTGFALAPVSNPALCTLLGLPEGVHGDIKDPAAVTVAMRAADPEIVFHLAAQALVRASFDDPVGTFATNVVGTAVVLDSVRRVLGARAVIVVTSDKCYENREWAWGYREIDPLGGHDPYSASKGAAEIVTASMRRSYFAPSRQDGHPARIASVRAGNVIGGGDWSVDRLVPDIVRSMRTGEVVLRNPAAVRPWQHVLEPVAAYLGIAERLFRAEPGVDDAFNFGPTDHDARPVADVADALAAALGGMTVRCAIDPNSVHEAQLLRLDCAQAATVLGWRPRWRFDDTIRATADWYAGHARGEDVRALTAQQIVAFEAASPYS